MGFLSGLTSKFTGSISKYSGKTDFLEAVLAAAALVAYAPSDDGTAGDASDAERAAAIKAVVANKNLAGAFDSRTIEATAEQMFNRAAGGRMGRIGLEKEITDVAKDKEMSEAVLVTALDISEGDGSVSKGEKLVIDKIAKLLGLDASKYL